MAYILLGKVNIKMVYTRNIYMNIVSLYEKCNACVLRLCLAEKSFHNTH